MEHLFSTWQEVLARLRSADHVLFLTDFDGTLTPIVAKPDLPRLTERTRRLLLQVVRNPRYTVGVVSGRALEDLKGRVSVDGILYAGNYGMEIEGPRFRFVNPQAEKCVPYLQDLYRKLRLELAEVQGALVEDKGLTLSVHYRLVIEEQRDHVRKILDRATASGVAGGTIKVSTGKKVFEITPAISWHKGKVMDVLLARLAEEGSVGSTLPFFLGDDTSDEEAFETAEKHGGISILVGEESTPSRAGYFLTSPAEVDEFLERLT